MNEGHLRIIWGLANSKEVRMSSDALHCFVFGATGKNSLKLLTSEEAKIIIQALKKLKLKNEVKQERTDVVGVVKTQKQRKLIYRLTDKLGWNDDNKRINAFCYRMFRVDNINELEFEQASKLIEILKKMLDRMEEKN